MTYSVKRKTAIGDACSSKLGSETRAPWKIRQRKIIHEMEFSLKNWKPIIVNPQPKYQRGEFGRKLLLLSETKLCRSIIDYWGYQPTRESMDPLFNKFRRDLTNLKSIISSYMKWDYMMNVDENVDDLKHYAGTTCILEPWNPPTPWRHVSYLNMSNFDTYKHKLKECWPLSLLNVWHQWIMALVMDL